MIKPIYAQKVRACIYAIGSRIIFLAVRACCQATETGAVGPNLTEALQWWRDICTEDPGRPSFPAFDLEVFFDSCPIHMGPGAVPFLTTSPSSAAGSRMDYTPDASRRSLANFNQEVMPERCKDRSDHNPTSLPKLSKPALCMYRRRSKLLYICMYILCDGHASSCCQAT